MDVGALLETLITAAPFGVAVLDRELRFCYVNPALASINQLDVDRHLGRHVREVIPAIAPSLEPSLQRCLDLGETVDAVETNISTGDSRAPAGHWVSSYYPLKGDAGDVVGVGVVVIDVTERRNAEEALRRSEERFRALVQHSSDVTVVLDQRGLLQYVSPAVTRVLGYPDPDAFIGTSPFALVHPEDVNRLLASFAGVAAAVGQYKPIEFRVRRGDGAWQHVEATATNLTDNPAVGGIVQNVRDITERKQAEAEREELHARERAARAEAEAANRAKDEFLSIVSHELRTPLTPILAYAQLLRSGRLSEVQAARALDQIERSARIQAQLLDDILNASRLMSGKLTLEEQLIDVAAVIEAALGTVQSSADAKGVELHAQHGGAPSYVRGDAARLQQVFWNLLVNAVKFTPRGGRVEIGQTRRRGQVVVTVRDTGAGIPEAFLPHIFDRFSQADVSAGRQHSGLGLGLAIVQQLVELHGGAVSAASPGPGRGAVFTVTLPIVRGAQPPGAGKESDQLLAPPANRLGGLAVLVVEDDRPTAEMLRLVLEQEGATVRMVESTAEALSAIEEAVPSVIVSDIGMPGRDGYALMRAIRSRPPERGGTTPAVAVTAYTGGRYRRRVIAAGYQRHLAKPLVPDALIAVVVEVAKLSPRAKGPRS